MGLMKGDTRSPDYSSYSSNTELENYYGMKIYSPQH